MSFEYGATVLADSISPAGVRVVTIQGIYPRFIHAEVLRHRVMSHSVMSSRAVPTEIFIDHIRQGDMFIPETFNERVKGMGVGDALDDKKQKLARDLWIEAGMTAADFADRIMKVGIDKSRGSRLLEPFLPCVDVVTATEWSNFFALRQPRDGSVPNKGFPAQPEFQIWARMCRDAMNASTPRELDYGDWHLPKISDEDVADNEVWVGEALAAASAGRVALVSFGKHEKIEDMQDSLDRQATKLVPQAHWSPSEHQCRPLHQDDVFDNVLADKIMLPASFARDLVMAATADPAGFDPKQIGVGVTKIWCGNLRGWVQLRKLYPLEHDRGQWLDQND